jgi:ubiquinone/menaquinone biosynthesis C-methylase UbiE
MTGPDDSFSDVISFYAIAGEETRLEHGLAQLEFTRSQELIRRFLPPPPAVVVDIGGAAGPYAFWLAGLGYEVHLVDATPHLIERARELDSTVSHRLASIAVGDARRLALTEASADAVLLLGPLYHLVVKADRLDALREARRICRPNGVVFVAGISRYAGVLDGLIVHSTLEEQVVSMRHRAVPDGQYRNTTGDPRYFTTAYFHRPEELAGEVADAEWDSVQVFGVEGPAWLLPDFDEAWRHPDRREQMLRVARLLEREDAILGASAHLLAIGRKP